MEIQFNSINNNLFVINFMYKRVNKYAVYFYLILKSAHFCATFSLQLLKKSEMIT